MLRRGQPPVKGTIKALDREGHGIIQTEKGIKFAFLFADVLSRRALVVGQSVIFSVRRVQNNIFAENISSEFADPAQNAGSIALPMRGHGIGRGRLRLPT
jgi:hypothetical protein